jgi:hypothetical protein
MRTSAALFGLAVGGPVLAFAVGAAAGPQRLDPERRPMTDTAEAAPKPPPPEEPPLPPGQAPPSRTGFQIAFRTGATIPAGKISSAQPMADVFAMQVPLQVELGAKPIPELFIGVYAGFAFGGVSSSFERDCHLAGIDCSSRSTHVGVEVIAYLLPSGWVNPWLGYGLGYESNTQIGQAGAATATQSVSGLELAHLMSGLDVRVSRNVGLGPILDVAIGRYSSYQRDAAGSLGAVDADIEDTALHAWVSLGARLVFLP